MVSNFINKSISFFANKKKILIISLSIIILFIVGFIYRSYATSTGVALGNDENTYDILLTDSSNTVSVPARSSKTVYYQFSNTNKGTIKYHIGYTSDNVIAKVWWDTEDRISGTIEYGEYKFIKLKLINESDTDDTITIKPILGFKDGGDLVVPNTVTLITDTIKETNTMSLMPTNALTTLGIDKANIKELSFVNDNIPSSDSLGSTNMNNDGSVKLWYTNSDTNGLYNVYIGSDNGITSFQSTSNSIFAGFTNLESIDLKYINTSNVINMGGMFSNCISLTDFDLSNFDTSNVTDMSGMFYNNVSLTLLNISNFNTSNVINMSGMFELCKNLTTLNISNFDTSNVINMSNMFEECTNLATLNISNFDTHLVETMKLMFAGCTSLISLDVSNFDTSNVTDMSGMFSYLSSIEKLNLSSFDFTITNVSEMFGYCNNLKIIDLRNADLSNISKYYSMFNKVPSTATIYLKDTQSNRDFMNNNFNWYTNVQYIPSS